MHILHISTPHLELSMSTGGATQRRILELAAVQVMQGHDVTVIGPAIDEAAHPSVPEGVGIVRLPRLRGRFGELAYARSAARVLKGVSPDVVHAHSMPLIGLALREYPALLHVDFSRYGASRPLSRPLIQRAIRGFNVVAACSQFSRAQFQSNWHHPSVEILHNGTRWPVADPAVERRGDPFTVGYLGRICRQKGSDIFGMAASLASERSPDCEWVAAGPFQRFGDRDYTAAESLLGPAVRYLGVLAEGDVAAYLRSLDAFVMPTVEHEMFGMAVVEAMSYGCVPIVTQHGGLPEVVGLAGFRVTPGSAEELVGAVDLARGLADSDLRHQRELSVAQSGIFSWERVAHRAQELYEQCQGGD